VTSAERPRFPAERGDRPTSRNRPRAAIDLEIVMKSFLPKLCAVFVLTLPTLSAPMQSVAALALRPDDNILSNGGFQVWDRGASFQGPTGPNSWYAMGDPSRAYTQADVAFTRITACPPAGNGSTLMQIRANLPQNFVSQSVENFGEYAGRSVTFSVEVRPLFPLATARIEIDDGFSSTSSLIQVSMGQWGRVSVRHDVAPCPTKLEFRIYPEQTLDVDGAMAVVGNFADLPFSPRPAEEASERSVPLGTVLDWFRFDNGMPVPDGFAICDGSPVNDLSSPFHGRATPNLANKFVRGVASVGQIGMTGGSDSHGHSGTTGSNQSPGSPDYWFMSSNQFDNLHNAKDGHTHTFTTSSASNVPAYVGLLKIIRVR
jgi:hypothetical protein